MQMTVYHRALAKKKKKRGARLISSATYISGLVMPLDRAKSR